MIYSPGYTPDSEQKPCVYSFSHATGLKVVKVCKDMEEARGEADKLNKKTKQKQLKLF